LITAGSRVLFVFVAFLIDLSLLAHAVDPNPTMCTNHLRLEAGTASERVMCYLRNDISPYNANLFCEKRGMTLYDAERSPAAKSDLIKQVRTWIGFAKASIAIKGRKGQRCSVIDGIGRLSNIPCKFLNHFICEYGDGESF
jgi:hypothetical protein